MKYIKVEIGIDEHVTKEDVKKLDYLANCLHDENVGKSGYMNSDILVTCDVDEERRKCATFIFAVFDHCPREQMPDVIIGDGNNITNLIFGPKKGV